MHLRGGAGKGVGAEVTAGDPKSLRLASESAVSLEGAGRSHCSSRDAWKATCRQVRQEDYGSPGMGQLPINVGATRLCGVTWANTPITGLPGSLGPDGPALPPGRLVTLIHISAGPVNSKAWPDLPFRPSCPALPGTKFPHILQS